ncbi:ER membrane glycoprotein subunit of the GPI transamidase complex-like protein [Cladophialophora chaetospira]|uniref:GPI mannosyltransferase 2 n=1 Tax=Cladophialophora chaetospira TaxID=386627 RepID=A0AA38X877_9EURO|nr:ER membrane glycoprotein subunit of the GPI transamidase complex-like protein [Cladophialophora chaetospira]
MTTTWSNFGRRNPIVTLFGIFVAWKSLVALIVLTAPGIGYDTSTSLSFSNRNDNGASDLPAIMHSPWLKFVRWDAVYFTHMSDEGHVFEQEWAFGIGLSELGLTHRLSSVVAGVLLSHLSHWLSVVQLWSLVNALSGEQKDGDSRLAFNTAVLHIISPAGVFLSTPCSESLFSFLSMSGFLSLVYALRQFDKQQTLAGSSAMVRAGFRFCAATMVRSNGILAGLPLLIEAITSALSILTKGLTKVRTAYLASLVATGLLVGVGLKTLVQQDAAVNLRLGSVALLERRSIPILDHVKSAAVPSGCSFTLALDTIRHRCATTPAFTLAWNGIIYKPTYFVNSQANVDESRNTAMCAGGPCAH